MDEDAALFGLALPAMELPDAAHFLLFEENAPVVDAVHCLDDCAWQYTGMGDLIGLDYPAARLIWQGLGITLDTEAFKGVMVFSKTVVQELNKRKKPSL